MQFSGQVVEQLSVNRNSGPADVVAFESGLAGAALPCRVSAQPELFFAESPHDVEQAKALCQRCPVLEACLAGALERREPWGVWGGQWFQQGQVVARKRPRGRPRKDAPREEPVLPVQAVNAA